MDWISEGELGRGGTLGANWLEAIAGDGLEEGGSGSVVVGDGAAASVVMASVLVVPGLFDGPLQRALLKKNAVSFCRVERWRE